MSRSRLTRRGGLILSALWLAVCSTPGLQSRPSIQETPTTGIPASGVQSPEAAATESRPDAVSPRAALEDLGPAPELENQVWLNTEGPLRLADLRGKVVLLDMWTFG
jgi:hypothetical protein